MTRQSLRRLTLLGAVLLGMSTPVLAEPSPTPGKTFKDCDKCPEMVVIAPGTVKIGNPKDFEDPEDAAKRPSVTIAKPYAIGRFEVTQAEWEALMGSNPSLTKGATNPVEHVTWREAREYAKRLKEKTGKPYRLPTDAEWELAARAGSDATYPFGEDPKQLAAHAWYMANSGDKTHPVGQLKANAFGVSDMIGNVWEWTGDCYGASFTKNVEKKFQDEWEEGCYRIIRGGSYLNIASGAQGATSFAKASLKQINHNGNVGLRIALPLE
ncbi:MAG: SUMF1/EgtB/PvdO family nonheme iron enzyme [Magnetospirillum sp.]|nr:SUMF1/EgtB/PvdO family nonheme iron enzyme [Magnetospirillum sp.]